MRKTSFLVTLLMSYFMAFHPIGGQFNDHIDGQVDGLTLTAAHAHTGATGIVKERMDRFKDSQSALKIIAAAMKSGEFDAIDTQAQKIALWGDEMVSYFPEASNPPPSEALDAIWQEMDQFVMMANANATAARRLQILARSGDVSQIKPAFNELVGSCKSCHQKFRQ